MKLLLDTHTFLWFISGSEQLSPIARSLIEDSANQSVLSIASVWEMAIKVSLGKLTLGKAFEVLIPQQLQLNGITLLGIDLRHTAQVASLPFHHRDPFDRLLIAQAKIEQLPLVSSDSVLDAYAVTRLW
jgi:PIN domain nuclease of toxin-antitoxin system